VLKKTKKSLLGSISICHPLIANKPIDEMLDWFVVVGFVCVFKDPESPLSDNQRTVYY
jgi:hypothetical protein